MNIQELLKNLSEEYDVLNHKCKALYAYTNSLNFEATTPNAAERMLLRDQLTAMENYRTNLLARINFYVKNEVGNISSIASDSTEQTGDGKRCIDFVHCENGKVVAIVPKGLIPKDLDDVDINKACDELAKAWRAYCEESHDLDTNHCGQDAHDLCVGQDPGFHPFDKITIKELTERIDNLETDLDNLEQEVYKPELKELGFSLQELIGMQVIYVTKEKCIGCPINHYGHPCKKVELVGGYFLCLAQPSSIAIE